MPCPAVSIYESFAHPTSMFLRNLAAMDTEETAWPPASATRRPMSLPAAVLVLRRAEACSRHAGSRLSADPQETGSRRSKGRGADFQREDERYRLR